MRKLASIQSVSNLEPIVGADRIEMATVMGWNVVVKKGQFKVGDRCVFFEIDSTLPDGAEWAEFLRNKKFRVKTCRLRGVLSQGLALEMSILEDCLEYPSMPYEEIRIDGGFDVGTDVTQLLGIKKYEPRPKHGFKSGQAIGNFPSFVPKTDETRAQSALGVFEEIKEQPFYYTVKCDGTSATYFNLDGHFGACSRNQEKRRGDNLYWQMAEKYKIEKNLPDGFAIQGELCGPGVQKNKLMLKEPELFVFDIFDIKLGRYLSYHKLVELCDRFGLTTVPLENIVMDLEGFDFSLEAWLKRAEGFYAGTENLREGLVVRPIEGRFSPTLNSRLSFKVLNNAFLLKHEG
jgi:RNA ligase (TIGR02306 family)